MDLDEINDHLNDKEDESLLLKIREEGGLEKEDLIGKGKVERKDGIWPLWIVGGIEYNVEPEPEPEHLEPEYDYSQDYLTIVPLENGTLKFTKYGTGDGIQYSFDEGETWETPYWPEIDIEVGSKVLCKANLTPHVGSTDPGIGFFHSTAKFDVEGNTMSMLYGDDFKGKTDLIGEKWTLAYLFQQTGTGGVVNAENMVLPATKLVNSCYTNMFMNCTTLTKAPKILPALELADNCYGSMFSGCTSLTDASKLPATNLIDNCYNYMFSGCTSLTKAPELPALELAEWCYGGMFSGCTNLNYIKCLATDISKFRCIYNWVKNVSGEGTFIKNASISVETWGEGISGIPSGWTVEDN